MLWWPLTAKHTTPVKNACNFFLDTITFIRLIFFFSNYNFLITCYGSPIAQYYYEKESVEEMETYYENLYFDD